MSDRPLGIEDMGEFEFIRSIKSGCHFSHERLIKGIGDDCAVIGPYEGRALLVSTDLLVEDVHFILENILPEHLGEKAVAVNLSDIAAMGGKALHLFLSLAIPRSMRVETLHSLYRGIKAMCGRYKVNILGGDTSASMDRLMINVAVIGEAPENEVLYRSGAGPDHDIYVTGTLGDSAAGLKLIKEDIFVPESYADPLKEAHNLPQPHLEAGRVIARSRLATAMIDVSDGLVSDLGHICEASGVGAIIYEEVLPISRELRGIAGAGCLDPVSLALSGGEDYRLLVTVPQENGVLFKKMFEKGEPCRVWRIGRTTSKTGIRIVSPDGSEKLAKTGGFDHFTQP